MMAPLDDDARDDVAVVGMAGRFPGAPSVAELWRNLCAGQESIRALAADELRAAGVAERWLKDPRYVRARGVLDGIDQFDADFFGHSAREAGRTGPQQRLLLEACWEALEGAGYDPGRYEGRIGLFAGSPTDPYLALGMRAGRRPAEPTAQLLDAIGNDAAFLTTQVSYRLGLRGPSVAIQTACSTSLVAVHLAGQSLRRGECDLALAGGVSITLPQTAGYLHQEGGIGSADGRCRAFDARAAGTVPGNGLGVVLLKRLKAARADGDHIHAVIRGSAVNNDGAHKVGFTAPSVDGQAAAIAEAMVLAGCAPETIAYVQAHGTGTPLGDAVEIAALRQAYRTQKRGYCALGSVKTNLGHLDAAAGVAGLIAVVLALEHGQIPPSPNFERPNPELQLEESPFYVNTTVREWPRGETGRRAAVSSFGIGGTNAHAVLEEAPPPTATPLGPAWHLLLLSARTAPALQSAAGRLAAHLREHPRSCLADVAHTLRVGRRPFAHRLAIVCKDAAEAIDALEGRKPALVAHGQATDEGARLAAATPRPTFSDGEPDGPALLTAVGRPWTAGAPIDGFGFQSEGRRRVPLPTYPFERQRYWLDPADQSPPSGSPVDARDPQDWLHVPTWRRSIPAAYLPTEVAAGAPWLLFRDTIGLGEALAGKLRERAFDVLTVTAADRFERVDERSFTLRPRRREDYAALWAGLIRQGTLPQGIVHGWTLGAMPTDDEPFDPDADEQALGFFSLLFLAQAIGEAGPPAALRLEILSTGLFHVTGRERLVPPRATVLGPCRVIPQEYPGLTCRVHDVVLEDGNGPGALVEDLAAEILSPPQNGVVAHRHGHRWLPAFERLPGRREPVTSPLVKSAGAYLITGGLEDPGLAAAEYLAARGARALVLVRPPAASGEPANDRLAALEDQGVQLAVESVDVADLAAVEQVMARAEARFGSIQGAVHAAREPSEGLMQFKTAPAAARVLAVRARGAHLLQRVLETRSPDFLVLFGSSTGVTGIVGQADDCAANAFLDALAWAQAARGGTRTLVVDWPPWRRESEAAPLAPLPALIRDIEEAVGITREEGLAVLDGVLGATVPQVVIARGDFALMAETQSRFTATQLREQLRARGGQGRRQDRPAGLGACVPPANDVEAAVARVWEELFGFGPIGSDDDFFELGGHSLLAIEMVSRLRETLGAEIPLGAVFESSRLFGLARVIAGEADAGDEAERFEELLREVEALSPEEAARLLQAEAGVPSPPDPRDGGP